jgi:GT2 family glycosyltransferase
MLIPIAALEVDLAADSGGIAVASRFRRARVLARWCGVPVGIVEVSVRHGRVETPDILQALQRVHPHALAREAVRRSLLTTGVGERLEPESVWNTTEPPAPAMPKISVVVCTRDRPSDLAACLASITRLEPQPFEVLVVDNAPSTDATARLMRERFSPMRYVLEPAPGLDHARNRAIAAARGEIIAFTDDDVVVDSAWIGAIARAFAADPEIGLLTGLAEPLELETRAQILFERYGGFGRGCRRLYSQAPRGRPMPWTLVGAGQLGAGANMAVQRDVFDRIGKFDPALDVGTSTLGGGDHDLFFRILRAGYLCVYEPTAVVRHRHRRTVRELRRLLFCYGHATRCFLDRERANFPSDRPAIDRLQRWWWREWAWRRAREAFCRPAFFPFRLVWTEIKGFWAGGGAYRRTLAQIVRDESLRPDAPQSAPAAARPARAQQTIVIETALPLRSLPLKDSSNALDLLVQWQGRPLGTLRLAGDGGAISARRLADEIAHHFWPRLLAPLDDEASKAFVRFTDAFANRIQISAPISAATSRPSATLVITTCDRPAELRRCLQSTTTLQTSRPVQVVVVDNRPHAGAAAAVVREFPGVEYVSETRPGSSYARNAGIAAARGDFVVMLDDDMEATPRWLEALLAPFDRADVMVVTGNTLPARLETAAERWFDLYGGFGRGFHRREFNEAWFHQRRWRAVPTWQIGGSGNAAFRREIFSHSDIGRFSPLLGAGVPTGVGEDTKLFYDVLQAGFSIVYEPGAIAWHHHRVTLPALRRQLYAYSRGHVAYHLATLLDSRDRRALVRIFAELPLAFARRAWARVRRKSAYPLRLLAVELAGTLAGPWSLWRAHRHARALACERRPAATRKLAAPNPAGSARPAPALQTQP